MSAAPGLGLNGSATYPTGDPPVWDYDHDPRWAGLLAERTARDAATMLQYRFVSAYAFRPVPADVYLLASSILGDCYANPQCSPDAVSKTDLTKIYRAPWVERNLSAGLVTYRDLGCARQRAVANPTRIATGGDAVILAPDPNCVGQPGDPIQEALERAKAYGDDIVGPGGGFGVSAHAFRHFVEEHRDLIAPQPPGQFTITNISAVFPGGSSWFLPIPGGGRRRWRRAAASCRKAPRAACPTSPSTRPRTSSVSTTRTTRSSWRRTPPGAGSGTATATGTTATSPKRRRRTPARSRRTRCSTRTSSSAATSPSTCGVRRTTSPTPTCSTARPGWLRRRR